MDAKWIDDRIVMLGVKLLATIIATIGSAIFVLCHIFYRGFING